MLAPPPPRRPRVRPLARLLRGSWRPFLLSFNLTFPATGSQALIQRHWLPHGNPPPGSVRATERARGWDHPPLLFLAAPRPGKERRFSTRLRVFFDPLQRSFPRLHSLTRLESRHDGNAYFYALIATFNIAIAIYREMSRLHFCIYNVSKYFICASCVLRRLMSFLFSNFVVFVVIQSNFI